MCYILTVTWDIWAFPDMYALCPWAVGHTYQAEPSCPCYNSYYIYMSYFAWEDQSDATYCIVHTVLISCITVLYESYKTAVKLIGQIQYNYALNWENTEHSGKYNTAMRSYENNPTCVTLQITKANQTNPTSSFYG